MNAKATFKTLSIGHARNNLSALASAAEEGKATVVTKRGRPVAMIIPMNDARRLYPAQLPQDSEGKPSFAELLMSLPVPFEVRRSRSGVRRVEFLIDPEEPASGDDPD